MKFEEKTDCWYTKGTGLKKTHIQSTTYYYYCNRTGHYKSKGTGVRTLKTQGTSKINAHCTAAMIVTQDVNGVVAEICDTHYNHSTSLGHLRLPSHVREQVAAQLAQGVTFQRVLDNIRDGVTSNKINRAHLTTRKDIANIERAFGLQGNVKHKDDATSVAAWVMEMADRGDCNPVLLYKPQGKISSLTGIEDNDFILVIQTPLQAAMLKEFGNGIILIDSTHGTTGYDFQLITIVVVDELGEGYPAAWCLSNREDHILLTHFLTGIHSRCGNISPIWFMSDDAEQFYSAWSSVFGFTPQKLLCTWHVDRAWRKALKKHVKSQEVQALVYTTLRTLMEETNVDRFEELLHEAEDQFASSEDTQQFGSYFETEYYRRPKQWAMCYRLNAGVNTNMFVEAFHHVLKYIYFKGRVNKRVDKCVGVLVKIARDKAFERLIKLKKRKSQPKK